MKSSTAIPGVKLTPNLSPLSALEMALLKELMARVHERDHGRCLAENCYEAMKAAGFFAEAAP